jgi:single-strand DNA-binding protein
MASYNRVILMGNLTRDPELKHAPSGSAVTELRLAVSETHRDRQTQQPKEVVCFVDVTVWERQAELCQQYLVKGSPILVEGRLQYDEWKTPQGEARSKLRVRADRVQFLGPSRRSETADRPAGAAAPVAAAGRPAPAAAPVAAAPVAPPAAELGPDTPADTEDLPF